MRCRKETFQTDLAEAESRLGSVVDASYNMHPRNGNIPLKAAKLMPSHTAALSLSRLPVCADIAQVVNASRPFRLKKGPSYTPTEQLHKSAGATKPFSLHCLCEPGDTCTFDLEMVRTSAAAKSLLLASRSFKRIVALPSQPGKVVTWLVYSLKVVCKAFELLLTSGIGFIMTGKLPYTIQVVYTSLCRDNRSR